MSTTLQHDLPASSTDDSSITPTTPPNDTTLNSEAPISTQPRAVILPVKSRPPQRALDMLYTDSISNLARCDQDYCEDIDDKWAMTALQYVIAYIPDSWDPINNNIDNEVELVSYVYEQLTNTDISTKIQNDLNAHRFEKWKNPLYNYDARNHRSPLWYRGAADLWRRNKFQQQGRPGTLQCLDFSPSYHQLRRQYQENPDNHKLERKLAYATWDQYSCVAGLQCPSLQPFALWCGHNPAATPDQIKQCLQILPRYIQCSKPGFIDTKAGPSEDVFITVDEEGNPLPEADLKRKHRKKVRAALRLRNWVVQAEIVTNQRRLMLDPRLKEKMNGQNNQSIFGPTDISPSQQIELLKLEHEKRSSQLRKDIADETGDDLSNVVEETEKDFLFAGNSDYALHNKKEIAKASIPRFPIYSKSKPAKSHPEDSNFGMNLYSDELSTFDDGFSMTRDNVRDTALQSSRSSKFGKQSPNMNNHKDEEENEHADVLSKYGRHRLPSPKKQPINTNTNFDTSDDYLDEDFPELFHPIQTSRSLENGVVPSSRRSHFSSQPSSNTYHDNYDDESDYSNTNGSWDGVGKVPPGYSIPKLNPEPDTETVLRLASSQDYLRQLIEGEE